MWWFVTVYLLGGVTFLPSAVWLLYLVAKANDENRLLADQRSAPGEAPRPEKPSPEPPISDAASESEKLPPRIKGNQELRLSGIPISLDDPTAVGWVMFSPTYLAIGESYETTPMQDNPESARSSLQRLVSNPNAANGGQLSSTLSYKTLLKLPRYWAMIRGGQLQLYTDESGDKSKIVDCILLEDYLVTLWPRQLQEFELFYKKYPICVMSRTGKGGLVSLDLNPNVAPQDAYYFYCENPTRKEDLYFAMIAGSRSHEPHQSLGPRDPTEMAEPIAVSRAEKQELQSRIWRTEGPLETQWLNALMGRMFLALKDSSMVGNYLRNKFAYKLRSASNNYIGEIEVVRINCGSSAPFINNVSLRELSPDGNLEIEAGLSYNGGFCVTLATIVKLAVGNFKAGEIPVEMTCTVRQLDGTMIFRVKPAPSSRMWYAFESLPDIDLLIEPAVYDTRISYSFVTNYIRKLIFDTLKESMVMPFMDDWSFYDTSPSFYRGGIWTPRQSEPPVVRPKPVKPKDELKVKRKSVPEPVDQFDETTVGSVNSVGSTGSTGSTGSRSESGSTSGANTNVSTVKRLSEWVKRKRSQQSLRNTIADSPQDFASYQPGTPILASQAPPEVSLSNSSSLNSLYVAPPPSPPATNTTNVARKPTKVNRRPSPLDLPESLTESLIPNESLPEVQAPDVKLNEPAKTAVRRKPVPESDSNQALSLASSLASSLDPTKYHLLAIDNDTKSLDALKSTDTLKSSDAVKSTDAMKSTDGMNKSSDTLIKSLDTLNKLSDKPAESLMAPPRVLRSSSPTLAPSSASVSIVPEIRDWKVPLQTEAKHLRNASQSSSSSIHSRTTIDSSAPSLPPRKRKYVVLNNVPPEPDRVGPAEAREPVPNPELEPELDPELEAEAVPGAEPESGPTDP